MRSLPSAVTTAVIGYFPAPTASVVTVKAACVRAFGASSKGTEVGSTRQPEGASPWPPPQPRPVRRHSLSPRHGQRPKVRARGVRTIQYGSEEIDISCLEQIVDPSQARYIADCLQYAYHQIANDRLTVPELVHRIDALVQRHGLEVVQPYLSGAHAWARPFEVAAALNRLRTLQIGTP